MVRKCTICKAEFDSKKLFSFPRTVTGNQMIIQRRLKWIEAVKKSQSPEGRLSVEALQKRKNLSICQDHFVLGNGSLFNKSWYV